MFYFVTTLGIALLIVFLLLLFTLKNGISPMPTSPKVRMHLLSLLPDLEEGTIVELGSGWGNLIFPLAKKYSKCKVIGYENSPIPYIFSSLLNHAPNLKILRQDFFEKSLQDADLVVCYLYPKGMEQLKSKFEKELRPGTKVVSHTYEIPGWTPHETIEADDLRCSKIYLYEVV
ncbi:MAG: SAM-dependent methyltransferase [Simkaniaceae bacterium]